MKWVVGIIILAVLILGGSMFFRWDRVEVGNVGILVDKGSGSITPVNDNSWKWLGRYEELVEWEAGQKVYLMDRGEGSGQGPTTVLGGDPQIVNQIPR